MPQPTRDWDDAHEKLLEEGKCRLCGLSNPLYLEKAHILDRSHDVHRVCAVCDGSGLNKTGNRCGRCGGTGYSKTLWVNPLHIVPLCRPPHHVKPDPCHTLYDQHQLDLLPVLSPEEQTEAVRCAGGIIEALRRVAPTMFDEKRQLHVA